MVPELLSTYQQLNIFAETIKTIQKQYPAAYEKHLWLDYARTGLDYLEELQGNIAKFHYWATQLSHPDSLSQRIFYKETLEKLTKNLNHQIGYFMATPVIAKLDSQFTKEMASLNQNLKLIDKTIEQALVATADINKPRPTR